MKKRMLSMILALVLILSVLPGSALAANGYYWPVPGHFTLSQGLHDGNAIDISDGSIGGAAIVAAIGGTVRKCYYCTSQHLGDYGDCGGFGTGMIIDGDDGRTYQYAHMQAYSIPANVYAGARVESGQQIGQVGTTGNSSGNHLHFAISNEYNPWGAGPDPYAFLESQGCIPVIGFSWPTGNAANKYAVYETNAVLVIQVTAASGSLAGVSLVGMDLYDSSYNLVASKSEVPAAAFQQYGTSYAWYDVNAELGYTMQGGTNYFYRFFVVNNGVTYYSDYMLVTTLPHSFGSWTETQAPTCEQDGIRERVCSTCGFVEVEIDPAMGHDWVLDEEIQPTATQAGYRISHCTGCNEYDVEVLPATGGLENVFADVPADAYYADAVAWAVEQGITTGTSATTFGANQNCTREQVVTFLWHANGDPEPTLTQSPFSDVPMGKYYTKAVLWAYENGIAGGTSTTVFGTGKEVTRGQFVTFLYNAKGKPAVSGTIRFTDVPTGSYFEKPVLWAVQNGITGGTSITTFSPSRACTRAQVVTFLYQAYGK